MPSTPKLAPQWQGFASIRRQYFSRIHDVLGIERRLDIAHHRNGRAMLGFEERYLARADAMLPRAGALHLDRPMDHPLIEPLHTADLVRIVHVAIENGVEIPI